MEISATKGLALELLRSYLESTDENEYHIFEAISSLVEYIEENGGYVDEGDFDDCWYLVNNVAIKGQLKHIVQDSLRVSEVFLTNHQSRESDKVAGNEILMLAVMMPSLNHIRSKSYKIL